MDISENTMDSSVSERFRNDEEFFFDCPELSRQLDSLHRLLQHGDPLQILRGPAGVGKSCFMAEILYRCQGWQVATLENINHLDRPALIRHLLTILELQPDPADDPVDQLNEHLSASARQGLKTLVAVDSAEGLPDTLWSLLVALSQDWQRGEARLLLVCRTDAVTENRIAALDMDESLSWQLNGLPPLDRLQTGDYLKAKLKHVGWKHEALFSAQMIDTLYGKSQGIPAKVDALAYQLMTGRRLQAPGEARDFPPGRIVRVSLGVLVLAGTFAWAAREPDTVDDPATIARVPGLSAQNSVPTPVHDEVPAPTRDRPAVPLKITPLEIAAPEKNVAIPAIPVAKPKPSGGADAKAKPPKPAVTAKPAAKSPTSTKPKPSGGADAKAKPPQSAAVAPRSVIIKTRQLTAADINWLYRQDTAAYVIQLLASGNLEAVRQFVARHNLGAEARILPASRDGKVWYVLAYGLYPSRQAANRALAALPAGLRNTNPWPRRILELLANLP